MAITSPQDVASRLGRTLTDEETSLVNVLIGDAENIIRVRVPGREMDPDVIDLDLVPQVVGQAIVRVLRNPDGYRSESAGGVSYTIDTRAAAGFLTILAEEWALLGLTAPSSGAGAFSFAPSFGLPLAGSWPTGTGTPPWL